MGNEVSRRSFSLSVAAAGISTAAGVAMPRFAGAFPTRAQPIALKDVLNIQQLDQLASRTMARADYHFIVGASDDGVTKAANREAYQAVRIRPRRLVDVHALDTRITLLGQTYASPIFLAPVGNQQRVHAAGELATAQAAKRRGHPMIAAQMANYSVAEIAATGVSSWFQLYPSGNRDFMLHLARMAEKAGSTALVLTVDGPARGNHEAARWFARQRDRAQPRKPVRMGNFEQFAGPKGIGDAAFTWAEVRWLQSQVSLPVVLKGIVTREDARLCRKHGVAGVIVSNHGGRQEGNGRGTLDVLPEVVHELRGRMPVLIDGGIRRGSDVFKALALGADAVCIGRPYLWGLGAFGQPGVEKSLSILQAEFERTMQYAGTPALADISAAHVWRSQG